MVISKKKEIPQYYIQLKSNILKQVNRYSNLGTIIIHYRRLVDNVLVLWWVAIKHYPTQG